MTMQQALLIDEIIRHIFQYSSEDGPRTLNALARSCRAWEGPALDYLWIRLSSIAPLLHLISGIRLVNGIFVLEQPHISPDLTRFHSYASRVKYITHRRHVQVHPAILSVLSAELVGFPDHPIGFLPSLRSVHLSTPNCDDIQACFSLSDKLSKLDLDLGFKSRGSQSSNEHIRQYLQEVVKIAPGLQRLSIRGSLAQNLLGFVSSMRCLHTLSLRLGSSLTTDALLAIASLQKLSELELHAGHFDVDELSDDLRNRDHTAFPPLKKLHMRAHAPVLELILDSLPSDTLHTLRLEAEEPTGVPVAWSSIFNSIYTKAANTLQNLTIEHHIELDDVDLESTPSSNTTSTSPGEPSTNTPIAYNDLQILRSVRQLRRLVLDTTLSPAICDEELATLVSGWPELEHLDLGSASPSTRPGQQSKSLTFQSLNALASRAPKLATLVMSADIQGIESATVPSDIPRQYSLTRVTLACSPTADSVQVAQYLRRLFPSLVEVDGLPAHEEEWSRVQGALRTLSPSYALFAL